MINFVRSSIYYQILLPLLGVVIFIALIFSYTAPRIITGDFEKRTDILIEQKLNTSQEFFQAKLDEMATQLEKYISDDVVLQGFKAKNYNSTIEKFFLQELSENESLVLTNNDGVILQKYGGQHPETIYFNTNKLLDNSFLGKNVTDIQHFGGNAYLCVATTIIYKDKNLKDNNIILTKKVNKDFVEAAAKVSNADLCLFNNEKLILTSLDLNNIGDHNIHTTFNKSIKEFDGETVKRESILNSGHFYKLIVKPFPEKKDLFLAASIRTDEIISARRKVSYQIWAGSVLAVLIVSGFGLYVSKTLTGSLRELMSSADEISAGNFDKVIKTSEINEVGALGKSLNRMSQNLLHQRSELQQSIQSLSALQELGKSLTATLDEKRIIEFTFESIMRLFEPDAGSIMIWNDKNKLLEIVKAKGLDEQTIKNVKLRLGEGIAGYVAQNKQPLLLNDGLDNSELKPIQKKEKIVSALSVPMLFKGQVFGVINISNDKSEHFYNQNDLRLLTTLASQASVGINNARIYDELQLLYLKTIKALGAAVDAKDPYTHGHSSRVADYAISIGEKFDFSEEELLCVQTAGYLHDIGKIGIPDDILLKPGKLNSEEKKVIQTHPLISAKILEPVEFPWNVVDLVCHHHEFFNGQGYPDGINGEDIPIGARILSVADSFEAMTSDRPYRKAFPLEYALKELAECSGSQFDPNITKIFIEIVKAGRFGFS